VFPSLKTNGRVPLSAGVFVADHLRKAAIAAQVPVPGGHRFGLHNLRHSLSSWMVNKGKVAPKTVQGILRHSRIQTTLDLYTQDDCDETRGRKARISEPWGCGLEWCTSVWVGMWVGLFGGNAVSLRFEW